MILLDTRCGSTLFGHIARVMPAALLGILIGLLMPNIGQAKEPAASNLPSTSKDDTKKTTDSDQTRSVLEERLVREKQTESNRFVITLYKPNYLLPLTYNSTKNEAYGKLESLEVKYQLSFKVPLSDNFFGTSGKLDFGYTQMSFWQAYNKDTSGPLRETNYEPELMLSFVNDARVLGFTNRLVTLGIVHQSNGRDLPESRGWNRIYANFVLERGNFYLMFKPWYRIPEDPKASPTDTRGDDNPDIEDYMGHGEVTVMYVFRGHTLALMRRNNLKSEHRGAFQIDWSLPMHNRVRGYIQYFNGYGESMIDYNHVTRRIGVGFILSDGL